MWKNRSFYALVDVAAIAVSYMLALLVRFGSLQDPNWPAASWMFLTVIVLIYFLVAFFYQPSVEFIKRKGRDELKVVLIRNFYMVMLLSVLIYGAKFSGMISRLLFGIFILYDCLLMYLFRMILKSVLLIYYQKPENKKKLLVCANESNVLKVLHKLQNSNLYNYEISAVTVLGPELINGENPKTNAVKYGEFGTYMESVDDLLEYLRSQVVDEALISIPEYDKKQLSGFIQKLERMGIAVHVTVNTFGLQEKEKTISRFGVYHVLTYAPRIFNETDLFLKRCMDICGGLVGVVLTLILGAFVGPAIYLESPGPIIFKQTRIGTNGRRFHIYKFRSMYADAEERLKDLEAKNEMQGGLMFKMKDDPRITKVGKFIRKTSIDEFPQFFNVLKGDMSLVGTRPPTEKEFLKYEEWHKRRLSLKPGITGLWQVSGRSSITEFEDVVKLDLEYIDNWSIWEDIRILFQTVLVVIFQRGAE